MQAMKDKHGPESEPLQMPVDPMVIYDTFGGLSHGRLGFMNTEVSRDSYKDQVQKNFNCDAFYFYFMASRLYSIYNVVFCISVEHTS